MKRFLKYFFSLPSIQLVTSYVIYVYLHIVYFTSKKQIIFSEDFNYKKFCTNPEIYVFWHNRLALMPFARAPKFKVNVLISNHRDGMIIAKVMAIFGFNIITGSSTKNSYKALKSIITLANAKESVYLTPDGPKGPRYQINGNVIAVSSLCQKYIIPMSYSCTRSIIFNSWDKFIFPLPFNKIVISYGTPIKAPRKLNAEQITKLNNQLTLNLNLITKQVDQITKLFI